MIKKIILDNLVKQLHGIIDGVVTSDEERGQLKEKITGITLGAFNSFVENQTSLIAREMTGNWWQRTCRPLLMIVLAAILFFQKVIFPIFGVTAQPLEPEFWYMAMVLVAGYIWSRHREKLFWNPLKNIDLPFLPKKQRAENLEK